MLLFFQGLRNTRCHLLLFRAELEIFRFGKWSVLGKESADSLHKFAAQIVFQRDHFRRTRSPPFCHVERKRNISDYFLPTLNQMNQRFLAPLGMTRQVAAEFVL